MSTTIKNKKQTGFTLIEMMVSIALFSIVMTASIGSILVISDSNKKARSLMSVMTNLNFAVDSITRSFKTGEIKGTIQLSDCITTNEISYSELSITEEFKKRSVTYCFEPKNVTTNTNGRITKQAQGQANATPITSPDVDIKYLEFDLTGTNLKQQPILTITMEGTVKVSPKISSNFSLQTSVSQRKLNR